MRGVLRRRETGVSSLPETKYEELTAYICPENDTLIKQLPKASEEAFVRREAGFLQRRSG